MARAERRERLGDVAHTRIVDTMTPDTNALVATRRRNLRFERSHLAPAVAVLDRRLVTPTKDSCDHIEFGGSRPTRARPCPTCRDG